jgi:hypothetical protein
MQISVVETIIPHIEPENWDVAMMDVWENKFAMCWGAFWHSENGDFSPTWQVWFLPSSICLGEGTIVADGSWLTLEDVQAILPLVLEPLGVDDDERAVEPPPLVEPTWLEHPWLLEYVEAKIKNAGDGGDEDDDARSRDHADIESVDADAVFEALEARRAHWAAEDAADGSNFHWTLLGGRWTMAHLGVEFDAFKGSARAHAEPWVVEHRLAKSARFGISVFGELDAKTLAVAWCHRMEYMFQRTQDASIAEEQRFIMTFYVEPPDVQPMYVKSEVLRKRVEHLRRLVASQPR